MLSIFASDEESKRWTDYSLMKCNFVWSVSMLEVKLQSCTSSSAMRSQTTIPTIAAIRNFFMAVLPREGRMYTFSWGNDGKLGHLTEPTDVEPHPLLGALENVPVVKIAAGYCYLLALACQPNGIWK
ncbi:uncharacterized protein LOC125471435 isoform X2 [Pyrus x bretschneideri]|uniref:uncharacterized protein LOC125471435 isoform X2 n=1 Tax=Pyrus x bretschneideri TaxID=225117 RepID=UPI00202DF59E|nr:uncharacterized protein LOC125471435 isoform X2 [Pyrus x bretschneideri]